MKNTLQHNYISLNTRQIFYKLGRTKAHLGTQKSQTAKSYSKLEMLNKIGHLQSNVLVKPTFNP